MGYSYLWVEEEHRSDAQREYNRVIWQADPDPKDFSRRFISDDGRPARYASVSRLDSDQTAWLGGLPDYIHHRTPGAESREDAIAHLVSFMESEGFRSA